ncbi:MAG: hypothetical protein H6732_15525 [Alphaproteobacteria bacterium]|nr:hypothetical protein [Alphaproteobacteria bacterium]
MDKDQKLRRYRRKKYSEIVDFPVEIVGSDGTTRQYDFEESVRLYQRRMTFAPLRYRDDDLVTAELGHCRSRIEQLRRSYFHLHGWTTPEGQQGPEHAAPDLAGELAAFLARVLRVSGRLDVRFTAVAHDGPASCWFVRVPSMAGGMLLYVFEFAREGAEDACHAAVRDLRAHDHATGDVERLVASHHVGDGGFVLSGRASEVDAMVPWSSAGETTELEPTPWDEVEGFVRRGDLPAALLRCRSVLEEQPWHRDAYAMGALLAVHLRRPGDAEDLAFVGSRYFPGDALLHQALGLAHLHQGRVADAARDLGRALELDDELVSARSLLTLAQVQRGAWLAAWRISRLGPVEGQGGDVAAHQELVGVVRRFLLLLLSATSAALSGLCIVAVLGPRGILPLLAVIALGAAGILVTRRRFLAVRDRHLLEDPASALLRVRRTRARRSAT